MYRDNGLELSTGLWCHVHLTSDMLFVTSNITALASQLSGLFKVFCAWPKQYVQKVCSSGTSAAADLLPVLEKGSLRCQASSQ